MSKISRLAAALVMGVVPLFGGGSTAYAELSAAGPVDPAHGYPIWYQDATGLTLELCLSQDKLASGDFVCGLASTPDFDPDSPIVFSSNFPDEAFWWAAGSTLNTNGGKGKATLTLALEAAFNPDLIARENEIAFGRVRVRFDAPKAGTYRVTHPYGVDTFVATSAGQRIFVTEDVGADVARVFDGALTSRVGPFLTIDPTSINGGSCLAPPPGYIADSASACRINGSPYGTNFFRIEGPGIAGTDSRKNAFPCPGRATDLNCVQTSLFVLTGKIASKFGVSVTRATYTRGAWDPGIEVFAFTRAPESRAGVPAILQQDLVVSLGGVPTNMVSDGRGKYFAFLAGDVPSGTTITVTNVSDATAGHDTVVKDQALIDVVTIREAYYYRVLPPNVLEIVAVSSDEVTPGVTLTAYADDGKILGVLTPGPAGRTLVLTNVTVPPRKVTVKSSRGGKDIELVDIGYCERAGTSLRCRR